MPECGLISSFLFSVFMQQNCLFFFFFTLGGNGGGMKRLGLRSSLLSNEEDVDARTKVSQTTKPQLFYDRVLWCVFIFLSLLNMLCK